MPKLRIQRTDRVNFWRPYRLYLNRTQVGKISFAGELELNLKPGRYQIHVGGFNAQEAMLWVNLQKHTKALEIRAHKLPAWRYWPKRWQLNFLEKGPIQLASPQERVQKKKEYQQVLWKKVIFNVLFLALLGWPFYLFIKRTDGLFLALVILGLLILLQINVGINRYLLRKEPKPGTN